MFLFELQLDFAVLLFFEQKHLMIAMNHHCNPKWRIHRQQNHLLNQIDLIFVNRQYCV
ncbi:MAG: hypothetical protein IK065_00910 [Neisseriaceae bacterium]|nr:hypothetical protein [Neisseriaceae bacterium]